MKSVFHTKKRGFTLVELIVVIAIVAILAAVSIVGFSQYIDRGRFSNDTQVAANMSRILKADQVGQSEEMNAHQVRTVLESYMTDVSFTPEASDTGFFYLASENRVVASKYEDAGDLDLELAFKETRLLSDSGEALDAGDPGDTPEELFGEGIHLMTTEGSVVAEIVYSISSLLPYSNDIESDFDDLESYLDARTWLPGWLSGYDPEPLLESLLQSFDPATTLYVNNSNWTTAALAGASVTKVVFAAGITNLPSYDLGLVTELAELTLPGTVKTIESGALGASFSSALTTLNVPSGSEIKVFAGAIGVGITVTVNVQTISNADLTDYSDYILITRHDGKVQYDLESLPIRSEVTGYNVVITGNVYEISIYTSNGLVGYARQSVTTYTITYFSNNGAAFDYFATDVVYDNTVVLISGTPTAPGGKTFGGWYTARDGGVLIENGYTLQGDITLYAQWINA